MSQSQKRIAEPSVMSLFLRMQFQGAPLSSGTGFIVNTRQGSALITNWHNVTGRNPQTGQLLDSQTGAVPSEVVIFHNRAGQLGTWIPTVEPLYNSDGKPLWREHPMFGQRVDCVALPLTHLTGVQRYPYPLSTETDNVSSRMIAVTPAEPVSVVGFPFGLRSGGSLAIWATGFVASEPEIDHDDLPLFLIDCRGRPGQSGSAVIAYRAGGMVALDDGSTAAFSSPVWRFLGIYSGRINDQSDLGMVWKARAIEELIATL